MSFRLYKKQKLCSVRAIDMLFDRLTPTQGALAYPLRAVWHDNPGRHCDSPLQFLISIPKKKLRHAVDRVKMRRRVREAFRLNIHDFEPDAARRIDVAFVYVADKLEPYAAVEKAMRKLLAKVVTKE